MFTATSNSRPTTRADPARLLRAYRATVYQVDGIAVRIGRRSPALDAYLSRLRTRTACLLSSDNPGSRRMPPGWNCRARVSLVAALRRVEGRPATGAWRGWSEDHLLLALPTPRARALARRFRQNAIVVVRRGAPARLLWTVPWFDPRAPFLRPDLMRQR